MRRKFETYRGSRPVILDVGASDGSTSLNLIQELDSNFTYYYVTDLNLPVLCSHDLKGVVYLRIETAHVYCGPPSIFSFTPTPSQPPFRLIAKALLAKCRYACDWRDLVLAQPDLLRRAKYDA